MVGRRDTEAATAFISDLTSRLAHRVQPTTDGHKPYLEAVEEAFGSDIDYAQLIKLYGTEPGDEKRYSPAKCIGVRGQRVTGDPDPAHISTSYIERQNLTMRMGMRRFTRLTNAFSKKIENLAHAVALHFLHYNFARPHMSLGNRTTPATAASLSDHVWTVAEIISLLDAAEAQEPPAKRGPYKPRQPKISN